MKYFIRWIANDQGGLYSRLGHPAARVIVPEAGWSPMVGEVWQVEVLCELPQYSVVRGVRKFPSMRAAREYCEAQIQAFDMAPLTAEDEAWFEQQPLKGANYYFCSCGGLNAKVLANYDRSPKHPRCLDCGRSLATYEDVDCGPKESGQYIRGEAVRLGDPGWISDVDDAPSGRSINRVYHPQPGVEFLWVDDEVTPEQRKLAIREHRRVVAVEEWHWKTRFFQPYDWIFSEGEFDVPHGVQAEVNRIVASGGASISIKEICGKFPGIESNVVMAALERARGHVVGFERGKQSESELFTMARKVVGDEPHARKIDQVSALMSLWREKTGALPGLKESARAIDTARKEAGLEK